MTGPGGFGPWAAALSDAERRARFREFRALAFLMLGGSHPLTVRLAEAEGDAGAASDALALLERLPALRLRRLLSTWGALARSRRQWGHLASGTLAEEECR